MSIKKLFPEGLDLQGHRGCRGLYPENTVQGFLKAIDLEVTTLEMDVVISKDREVVVSHDPYMSHEICYTKDGFAVNSDNEKSYNLYRMDYEEIRNFDCGSHGHPRFPGQVANKSCKPLLSEVITKSELKSYKTGRILYYNIEIKSTVAGDNIFHPTPEYFSDLLLEVLFTQGIHHRTTIQCFDIRPLQYIHQKYPESLLSLLIENDESFDNNIKQLGFFPDIYSPEYMLVDKELIKNCHKNAIRIVPWTVNDLVTMKQLIESGVNGLISDFPDKYKFLK